MDRIDRAAYWLTVTGLGALFTALWLLLSWPPQIALTAMLVGIPRLHDIGRTGFWTIGFCLTGAFAQQLFTSGEYEPFAGAFIVEIVSAIVLAVGILLLGLIPGQPGANAYGAPSRVSR